MIEKRDFGSTGLQVSALGFGCGAVGGLMVRGDGAEQASTVARAIDLGINFFDTARVYGDGASERNLGRVLSGLGSEKRSGLVIASKARIFEPDLADIGDSIRRQVEESLQRLGLDTIDLIQLHNRLGSSREMANAQQISLADVGEVVERFESLRAEGKVRFWGITGLGETEAVHAVVDRFGPQSVQCCYNLLNPSGGSPVESDFAYQDFQSVIDVASGRGAGTIGIRVLAGGALTGSVERHPNAAPAEGLTPIASGSTFLADLNEASRFDWLVKEGHVESLVEAAVRFAISKQSLSTALVGIASANQLEAAASAAEKGPLPEPVLARLQ